MKRSKPLIDVRLWGGASFAIAVVDDREKRYTLVEGDALASARVILVDKHHCVEAVAQPIFYRKGSGRATVAARMDESGEVLVKARRIFPFGTLRLDSVKRSRGHEASTSRFDFANGSSAEITTSGRDYRCTFMNRAGDIVQVRAGKVSPTAPGQVTTRFSITDGLGREIGNGSSEKMLLQRGGRLATSMYGADGDVGNLSTWSQNPDGSKSGVSTTRAPDGSVSVGAWNSGGPGQSSTHETIWGANGSVTNTSSFGTASGSTSITTITDHDGHTTETISTSHEGADGSWVSNSETKRDGQTVGRSVSVEDKGGANSSTTSITYNPGGGEGGMPPDDGSGGGGDVPRFGGRLAGSATLMVNEEGNYQSPRTPSDGGDEGGDSFVEIRNSFISQVHTGGQPSGGSRGDGG